MRISIQGMGAASLADWDESESQTLGHRWL
jgi:hypothetical protein